MTTQDTKEKKVPCIWRDGCERGDSCSQAGRCLGLLSNRVAQQNRSGFSKETLQMLEDAEHEDQP